MSETIWGVVRLADGTWPEAPLIETFRLEREYAERELRELKFHAEQLPTHYKQPPRYRLAQFREVK